MKYYTPKFDVNNLSEDLTQQNRINFFWRKWLFSTKERIFKILDINRTVFNKNSWYIDAIEKMAKKKWIYNTKNIRTYSKPPFEIHQNDLPQYLHNRQNSIHHKVFKNPILLWHKSASKNKVRIPKWEHWSFHRLIDKNLYPHLHMSHLLEHEASMFENWFINEIKAIESEIDELFKENPLNVYTPSVFQQEFYEIHNIKNPELFS